MMTAEQQQAVNRFMHSLRVELGGWIDDREEPVIRGLADNLARELLKESEDVVR